MSNVNNAVFGLIVDKVVHYCIRQFLIEAYLKNAK